VGDSLPVEKQEGKPAGGQKHRTISTSQRVIFSMQNCIPQIAGA
jgi:hypothetical protein